MQPDIVIHITATGPGAAKLETSMPRPQTGRPLTSAAALALDLVSHASKQPTCQHVFYGMPTAHSNGAAALALVNDLLHPEGFGYSVTPEVRDAARRVVGLPASETIHGTIPPVTAAKRETIPMTRFCPECGSVGPVPSTARDCCPDGGQAFMVPAAHAHKLSEGFQAWLAAPDAEIHKAHSLEYGRWINFHAAHKGDYDDFLVGEHTQAAPSPTGPDGWKQVPAQVPDSAFPWVSGGYAAGYQAKDKRDTDIVHERAQRIWNEILDGIAAPAGVTAPQAAEALDAARYRFLRVQPVDSSKSIVCVSLWAKGTEEMGEEIRGAVMDAAIDVAIAIAIAAQEGAAA